MKYTLAVGLVFSAVLWGAPADLVRNNRAEVAAFREIIFPFGFEIWDRELNDGRMMQILSVPSTGISEFYDARLEDGRWVTGQFTNLLFEHDAHRFRLSLEVHYVDSQSNETFSVEGDLYNGTVYLQTQEFQTRRSLNGFYTLANGIAQYIDRTEKNAPQNLNKLTLQKLSPTELLFRRGSEMIGHLTLPENTRASLVHGRFLILGLTGETCHVTILGKINYHTVLFDLEEFTVAPFRAVRLVNYFAAYNSTGSIWNLGGGLSTGSSSSALDVAEIRDLLTAFNAQSLPNH